MLGNKFFECISIAVESEKGFTDVEESFRKNSSTGYGGIERYKWGAFHYENLESKKIEIIASAIPIISEDLRLSLKAMYPRALRKRMVEIQ